jgi:hypothetical protein
MTSDDSRDSSTYFQQEFLPELTRFMSLLRMKGRGASNEAKAIEGQDLTKIAVVCAVRQVWEGYRALGGQASYAEFTKGFLGNLQAHIEQHERNEETARKMAIAAGATVRGPDDKIN